MPGLRIWSSKNCSPKDKKIFWLKLLKNSHEVMVDNCYKSRVALQVTARKVMIFFWRSAPFQAINWFPVPADKKVWGPLIYSLACLKFFSTESNPYKIQVCKCGLHEFDTPAIKQFMTGTEHFLADFAPND